MASLGDLDNDEISDIAVGAPGTDMDDVNNVGTVFVLYLQRDGTVKKHVEIGAGQGSSGFDFEPSDLGDGSFGSNLVAMR